MSARSQEGSSKSGSPGARDPDQPPSGFTAVNCQSPTARPGGRAVRVSKDSGAGSGSSRGKALASASKNDGHEDGEGNSRHERNGSETSHKRKRSMPDPLSPSSSSSHRRKDSPQPPTEQGKMSGVANGQLTPASYARRESDASPNGSSARHWRRSSADESSRGAQQLADALQRDNEGASTSDSPDAGSGNLSPEFQNASGQQIPGQVQQHAAMPAQAAPPLGQPFQKQRKRNFANRTKTGCLTCRNRKKKCDEGKPKCNNCVRGGFECRGYSQSGNFMKSSLTRDQHPLQAKGNGYDHHPVPMGYPPPTFVRAPSHYPPIPSDPHGYPRPMTGHRDLSRPMHDPNMRPDYGRAPGWHDQHYPPQPPPGPTQYPPHEFMHPHPPPQTLAYSDGPRDMKKLPPPPSLPSSEPRSSPYKDRDGSQSLVRTASSALNQPVMVQQDTEKQKMVNHQPFDPWDPMLKSDRHQCAIAVYKFNSGCANPETLTEGEKRQRFKAIIEGKTDYDKAPAVRDIRLGSVGDNVEVEAPFNCDYGYNIKIGHNTVIGPHCHIMDACTVKIGSNCWIGPNVSFYSQDGDHYPDMPRLNGQRRLARAEPIYVEDDVFIGGHAIILAGVKIRKGATVGANTTVLKEVPPGYTVVDSRVPRIPTANWNPPQPSSVPTYSRA